MIRIEKRQLGQPVHMAQGGVANVYRVTSPIAGLPSPPYAYKEFRTDIDPMDTANAATAAPIAVGMRDELTGAERDLLDSLAVWPLAVVTERGRVVGLLMSLIGSDFFVKGHLGSKVFEFQFLCGRDAWVARMGYDLSAADEDVVRLSLMAHLAYSINALHEFGWVYGDLSLRNVAVATGPPRILLMDCDGVAPLSAPNRIQLNSPFFDVPEILSRRQALQDQQTDVYKLALCVIRGLARGRGVTQLSDPTKVASLLGPEGVKLIGTALSVDRTERPAAKEIADYLAARTFGLATPPELLTASLDRRTLIRGRDAVVTWSQRYGTNLRIFGVNGFEIDGINPAAHPHGYAIRPPTGGPVYVELSNRHGLVTQHAGDLDYYELPQFDLSQQIRGALPRPTVPGLPQVPIPTALTALPPYPMVTTATHPVPRVDFPNPAPYLSAMCPNVAAASLGSVGVDKALSDALRAGAEGIHAEMRASVASLLDIVQKQIREQVRNEAASTSAAIGAVPTAATGGI